MKASVVIGLTFGDEGKGITTDFLCSQRPNDSIVIRFSGGQQAGHNVVIQDKSHVHSNFGSGTFRGLPSYFSEHTTLWFDTLVNEYNILIKKGLNPKLYVHPLTMITTPYDVVYNRLRERKVGHGTVGLGVGATMDRNINSGYRLYAIDLTNRSVFIEKLKMIDWYYTLKIQNEGYSLDDYSLMLNTFKEFLNQTDIYLQYFQIQNYDLLTNYSNLIFEGSQGILLDQNHGIFPHVTYANTTSKNAMEICDKLNIHNREIYYITRCYQTRHGSGWMSNEDSHLKLVNNKDEINVFNQYQKNFRKGEIDYDLLNYSLNIDDLYCKGNKNLVVTCLDQRPEFKFNYDKLTTKFNNIYESYSSKSENFKLK